MREPKRARTDTSAAVPTPVIAISSQERGNHYVARGRTTIVPGKSQLGMLGVIDHIRLHRLHLDVEVLLCTYITLFYRSHADRPLLQGAPRLLR